FGGGPFIYLCRLFIVADSAEQCPAQVARLAQVLELTRNSIKLGQGFSRAVLLVEDIREMEPRIFEAGGKLERSSKKPFGVTQSAEIGGDFRNHANGRNIVGTPVEHVAQ